MALTRNVKETIRPHDLLFEIIGHLQLREEYDKRLYIEKYLPHIGIALQEILELGDEERDAAVDKLDETLHTSRATGRPEP